MAEWKKVIVSGSNISQLTNDANYLAEGDSGVSLSGSFNGSFTGDGSGLTGVIASNANALSSGNGIASFSYDGSSTASVAVQVSGSTLTVDADGVKVSDAGIGTTQIADNSVTADKIAEDAVTNAKLADNAVGSDELADNAVIQGKIADAAFAVTASNDVTGQAAIVGDQVQISLSIAADAVDSSEIADDAVDSEHIAAGAIDFEHFSAGSVSGSAIADSSIPNAKLVASSLSIGTTDISLGNSSTTLAGLTSVTSTAFVGALTGNADTATTASYIAANDIDGDLTLGTNTSGNYVQSIANATNGGVTITNGSTEGGDATVALNINNLADGAVDVGADSIAIHSSGNGTRKESVVDLVAGIAGTNLSAGSGQLSLASSISGNHTFSNNLTIQGNLTVEGSQINANVANLDVEDRFILLNSGSSTIGDSGIVFGGSTGTVNEGTALVWDASYNSNDGRLGIVSTMAGDDTGDQTIAYHIAGVYEGTEAAAATAQADHVGNIRVESSEIYIYV